MSTRCLSTQRRAGFTLVELIMFIAIASVAIVGVLLVLNVATESSADPMTRKHRLAIAEALLEEIEQMPFTYCDPTDPNAATAHATTDCATVEALGPEAGEARVSATAPFNNVNDYWASGGMTLGSPISDVSGSFFAPAGYTATVQIIPEALNDIAVPDSTPPNLNAVRIVVTVTGGGDSLTLEGYRARYCPNDSPCIAP